MKVSEAKTKVCPFMEVFIDVNSVAFETMDNKNSYCICGDCMAWKYTREYETKEYTEADNEIELVSNGWTFNNRFDQLWDRELSEDKKEGYCKRLEQ